MAGINRSPYQHYNGWCQQHGKQLYISRKEARRAAKQHSGHLRPYPCDATAMWHLGHLPQAARCGLMSASEVYR